MNQSLGYEISAVMEEALATGLFEASLCTFQQPTDNFGPSGAPAGTYLDVAGLVDLECMAAPITVEHITADEMKALAETTALVFKHVLLGAYYPTVEAGWRGDGAAGGWRMLLGGNDGAGGMVNVQAFDIIGVESDSQRQMTRCRVRLATI